MAEGTADGGGEDGVARPADTEEGEACLGVERRERGLGASMLPAAAEEERGGVASPFVSIPQQVGAVEARGITQLSCGSSILLKPTVTLCVLPSGSPVIATIEPSCPHSQNI